MSSKMQGPEWIELRNFYLAICITSDLFKGCRTQCFGDLSFKIYFLFCFNLIRAKNFFFENKGEHKNYHFKCERF